MLAGYEWVDVDKDFFKKGGLAGASETNSYKAGVNWYLNPMFRVMLDYVYNDYSSAIVSHDNGTKDDREHMGWARFALEY
ncbi:MAG: hypothetical protein HZA01_00210 [Nitrospinae bacterium]|nr:hypothetical protein [Nitrospinota bacterium]